jgi:DNA-binding transcriptional LysR family regulator
MDILQLRYFITVAEFGSIQDAADNLYVSRQAVSRAILLLENELNVNLFVRTHNGIQLTYTGEQYVDYARELIEKFDELHKMMSTNQKTVDLAICIPISLYTYFADGINEFKAQYPMVDLKIIHCTSAETHEYLSNHKTDMIITWTKDKNACNQSDILIESSTYYMVNENNKLANKHILCAADIWDSTKIFYTDGFDLDYFKDPFFESKKGDYFVSDIMTIYDMVGQNIGIFPLPDIAIPSAQKGFKFIKYSNPDKVTFFYCRTADNLKMNLLKLKYCDLLKKSLKKKIRSEEQHIIASGDCFNCF